MFSTTRFAWINLFAFILLPIVSISGQVEKGTHFFEASPLVPDFLFGLNESYFSGSLIQVNQAETTLRPRRATFLRSTYGYFLSNGLLLKSDFVYQNSLTSSLENIGFFLRPMLRYYRPLGDNSMHLYAEAGFSNIYSEFHREVYGTQLRAEAGIGFNKMLSRSVGFDFTLNYRQVVGRDFDEVSRELMFHGGISAYLGRQDNRFETIQPAIYRHSFAIGATRFGMVTYNDRDFTGTRLFFSPRFTYFVTDKLAIGMGLGFDSENSVIFIAERGNERYEGLKRTRSYLITPSVRYKVLQKRYLALFLEGGTTLESRRTDQESLQFSTETTTSRYSSAYVGPVGSVFLTDHLAIEVGLFPKYDFQQEEVYLNAQFGFQVYLPAR